MPRTLTQRLIESHLATGTPEAGEEIELRIDQVLMHDATGPLIALEMEAMGLDRAQCELAVAYVDHLLVQGDAKNADDHLLLQSATERFGMWFSRAGNGISHPVHQQFFGVPGKTLLGADSHTPAAGAIGMLAIGAGGLEVALALAGEPYRLRMPEVWGVRLVGSLPDYVSAKDVILEMLRRHGVSAGLGRMIEYHGPGLVGLSAMDRHVIANMGTELGATTTVFPSDTRTREFLAAYGREETWQPLTADPDARYDVEDEIDLSVLEPLIALPSSPGNVVPVVEVAGQEIYQAYIGSSANPGYRDIAVAARIVEGRRVAPGVSFDINPTSRHALEQLAREGDLVRLVRSGARIHQAGCNGCVGMGQAPATGRRSLRTTPRNFPGRSGTAEDAVYLCSPETAAASALSGVITDPRTLDRAYPRVTEPMPMPDTTMLAPQPEKTGTRPLARGVGHKPLPEFQPLPDELTLPVILKLGDDVSTDEILPAGSSAMPLWSNVEAMSRYAFSGVADDYVARASKAIPDGGHAVIAGSNYGQGSSREHAALGPRYLGLRVVLARQFARIHQDNLANFGVLPLAFQHPDDYKRIQPGNILTLSGLHAALLNDTGIDIRCGARTIPTRCSLSSRQKQLLLQGGVLNWMRERLRFTNPTATENDAGTVA